jgi:hypothetical protein
MNQKLEALYTASGKDSRAWMMVTDQVMGGRSQGQILAKEVDGSACDCLSGEVSLENNGGFIQMQLNMKMLPELKHPIDEYDGIFIEIQGEPHDYNLHIKSSQLWLPWQSFRKVLAVEAHWQRFFIPFKDFESHRTFSTLNPRKITKIAVVAIGQAFRADVCVRSLGVYQSHTPEKV